MNANVKPFTIPVKTACVKENIPSMDERKKLWEELNVETCFKLTWCGSYILSHSHVTFDQMRLK